MLFVVLVTATWMATWRSNHLEKKLLALRETHGLITQDYGVPGDRFEIIPIGNYTSEHEDVFLLRVSTTERYRLRLNFFDGNTRRYSSETHDLKAIECAARILPSIGTVFVHDAVPGGANQTSFDLPLTERFYVRHGQFLSGRIDDHPIRIFCFLSSNSQPPEGINRDRYRNRESIEKTCEKHLMSALWFTIEPIR